MRVYCAVFALGLRRYSTYRAATAAGILTNTVFGIINAAVLLALFEVRPEINGYDARDAVTHVFVAQALIGPVSIMGPPLELAERIRTGDIAVDLMRPAPPLAWWLSHDLGRVAFSIAARSAPTFAAGALVFPLALPDDPVRWASAAAALLLASLVGFALRYLYALTGFWLLDTRGVTAVGNLIGPACSGMLLPLVLFPDAVAETLRVLPWAALVQIPVEVFLGKDSLPGGGPAGGLALQAAWLAALLGLASLLTVRASRKVVVQGG
ncbi:ABC transporter permease [Nocardiopsis baichengensis]|uniref:ABC transporter permease n=1 Tax=Nocardiopsis baichengensis TaxID=280240 RepID=UPI00034CA867|nr:ABC-2 family transporter protein [Nocardiopsis baichengensis]